MPQESTEIVNIVDTQVLVNNAPNIITTEFPLGEGWYALRLQFRGLLTLTDGAIAGAVVPNGPLKYIRNIRFETDVDGVIFDASGHALHILAQYEEGTRPTFVNNAAIAATAQTTQVDIPLNFLGAREIRPHDTILHSARYSRVTLTVTTGDGTDLVTLTGGGIGSYVVNMDIELERQRGALPGDAHPIGIREVLAGPVINVANDLQVPIKRVPGTHYTDIILFAGNVAAGAHGNVNLPFSGVGNNAMLATLSLRSNVKDHHRARRADQIQNENKVNFQAEAIPAGWHILSQTKDRRNFSSLPSGQVSDLRVVATLVAAPPAGVNLLWSLTRGIKSQRRIPAQQVPAGTEGQRRGAGGRSPERRGLFSFLRVKQR